MKILVTLSLLIAAPVTVMSQGGSTPLPPEVTTEMSGPVPTMTPGPTNDTPSSTSPGIPVTPAKFPNLSMSLTGVTTLSESSWSTFEEAYMTFNTAFYEANPQFGVTDLDILLELVSQDPPLAPTRRLGKRQLQETLTLVYNQALTYKISPDSNLEQADVVTLPFATQTSRDAFAALLRDSNDTAFTNIDSVSNVTQQGVADSTSMAPVGTTPSSVTESTAAASVTDGATTEAATTLSPGNTASECTTETSALNADTLIQMEYSNIGAAIERDATNDFFGFCNLLELLCEIDANNYSSNLTLACTAAGGQVTTRSLSFACSGTLNTIPIPEGLEVMVSNWPICIGNSCDPNSLPAEIEEQIDTTVNEMVNQIEAGLGGDVMCDSLGGNETGTTVVPTSTTPAPVSDTTLAPVMPPTTEPPTSLACSLRAFGTAMLGLAVALVIGA